MKTLWVLLISQAIIAKAEFGTPYLKDNTLCKQWSCLNADLGFQHYLPPKNLSTSVFKSLLPTGAWQDVIGKVVDICYESRPRVYITTCPGQALLHCVLDELIQNCPDDYWRKNDACAPLSTLAGFKYMFSQSRYENLEKNLPREHRPTWFLKNYFSSRCCNLPDLFGSRLAKCGFSKMIHYYEHTPHYDHVSINLLQATTPPTIQDSEDQVKVVSLNLANVERTAHTTPRPSEVDIRDYNTTDPFECCDLSDFIEPSMRSECDFGLTWDEQRRLVIKDTPVVTTTTTAKPVLFNNIKVVPLSCEKENCVFKKLNIVSEAGTVDMDAFSKLLDNMTSVHPSWTKAKARVVTKCLTGRLMGYTEECEINKVLACTLDVLSENCPHAIKNDPCKRTKGPNNGSVCQISTSKYRPKNRRQYCSLPNLVNHEVLSECHVNSISSMEMVADTVTSSNSKHGWLSRGYNCKQSTESTKCLLNKMGVLNKYGFMDYFKMKDRIRQLSSNAAWSSLTEIYLNAFSGMVMYGEHCSSQKKFLNVLDVMLTTCPVSRRNHTLTCNRIISAMANNPPTTNKVFTHNNKFNHVWRHYNHVFLPRNQQNPYYSWHTTKSPEPTGDSNTYTTKSFMSPESARIQTMPIKPQIMSKKPLVLLPVYLRMNGKGTGSLSIRPSSDGILRSDPFALRKGATTDY